MSMNEVHFLISKDHRTKLLMSKFRLHKHLKNVWVFLGRDFLLSQVMNHVCVVWLLTREILGSNLALVISFFE